MGNDNYPLAFGTSIFDQFEFGAPEPLNELVGEKNLSGVTYAAKVKPGRAGLSRAGTGSQYRSSLVRLGPEPIHPAGISAQWSD